MVFSKSFPRKSDKSVYPNWDEVVLDNDEEVSIEQRARAENIDLFGECVRDAKKILVGENLRPFEDNLVRISIALFEKRASHAVFWKENAAKDKFDNQQTAKDKK